MRRVVFTHRVSEIAELVRAKKAARLTSGDGCGCAEYHLPTTNDFMFA